MLDFAQKEMAFLNCLKERNGSYADSIRSEIEFYFDVLENDLSFLNKFQSEDEIGQFVAMLVSRVIMNEHQDSFDNIMLYYCQ